MLPNIEQAVLSYLAFNGESCKTWGVINWLAKDTYLHEISPTYNGRRILISKVISVMVKQRVLLRVRDRASRVDNISINKDHFYDKNNTKP